MNAFLNLLALFFRNLFTGRQNLPPHIQPPEPAPTFPSLTPTAPEEPATPSAGDLDIGLAIVDFEARRDTNGHLAVYPLPANDGGGSEEIAGINSRYHPEELAKLKAMPPALREEEAARYIQDYTRRMTGLPENSSLRKGTLFFLLDTTFNRGGGGSAWVAQTALRSLGYSVIRDRMWGPKTRAALVAADNEHPNQVVDLLRSAREMYERDVVGYRSNLWKGLVSRWNRVRDIAQKWNEAETPSTTPPVISPPASEQQIFLPAEGTVSLNAYYGTASPSGGYLDWFSFPADNIRLYNRSGANLSDRTGNGLDDHRCHGKIRDRLEAALRAVYKALGNAEFERQGWHVYGGCFNYRKRRGGSTLSTHSWGIAIDINPDENPFHGTSTTFSDEAIEIMERHGFLSGGRAWGKDWMHFQAAIPHISEDSYYAEHGLPGWIQPSPAKA